MVLQCCVGGAEAPRGAALLDAAFDAVRVLVLAVRAALAGDASGVDTYQLAFHAGQGARLAGMGARPQRATV